MESVWSENCNGLRIFVAEEHYMMWNRERRACGHGRRDAVGGGGGHLGARDIVILNTCSNLLIVRCFSQNAWSFWFVKLNVFFFLNLYRCTVHFVQSFNQHTN